MIRVPVPFILIVAGGISNTVDRILLGYVRDPLHVGSFYFNVADICIAIGIVGALWLVFRTAPRVH